MFILSSLHPSSHSVTRENEKEEVAKLIYIRVKLTKTINSHQRNLYPQKTVSPYRLKYLYEISQKGFTER